MNDSNKEAALEEFLAINHEIFLERKNMKCCECKRELHEDDSFYTSIIDNSLTCRGCQEPPERDSSDCGAVSVSDNWQVQLDLK